MKRSLLSPTESEHVFLLLGYPLRLSTAEAAYLHAMIACDSLSTVHLSARDAKMLAAKLCSINKKAYRISGRRLILLLDGVYRLNPDL